VAELGSLWLLTHTIMKIRIDLFRPKNLSPLASEPPPPGVKMSGIHTDPSAGPLSEAFFIIIDITKDVAVSVFASWLWIRIEKFKAERYRVNAKEVAERPDFDRIISEDFDKDNDGEIKADEGA
jgi:hypothetical protein